MNSRILIITQHFPPDNSGNASRIYDLAQNLISFGSEITVISPFPTFPHGTFHQTWKRYTYREIDGIKHFAIFSWQPSYENPSFLGRICYYITFPLHAVWFAFKNQKNYDIIFTSSPPIFCGIPGFFIKKFTKKKWLYDVRDLWINASVELGFLKKSSIFEKISRKYEKHCYHDCDMITVTTQKIKDTIIDEYGIPYSKLYILPNGVDTIRFKPSSLKKNRIIYAGNIGFAQDLDKFILALKNVNKKIPLDFLLVGDGDIKNDLVELVKKEGLEKNILFTGLIKRDKIPELIGESLIGIAPLKNIASLNYAIPTKIYEYMACGIPFISTGKGEIEHFTAHSQAGVMADNDVHSITNAIIFLLENKEMITDMGQRGRDFVEKLYDRQKIAKNLLYEINNVVF